MVLERLDKYDGQVLADEMGFGKSAKAIVLAERPHERVLIIVPAAVLAKWSHELCRWVPGQRVLVARKVASATPADAVRAFLADSCAWLVILYEQCLLHLDSFLGPRNS